MPLSSQDILYLSIAVSVIVFTGFMCWLIFYATQILKSTAVIVDEVRDRLLSISGMLGDLALKVERIYNTLNSFSGIGDILKDKVRSKAASFFTKKTPARERTAFDEESGADEAEDLVTQTVTRATRRTARK